MEHRIIFEFIGSFITSFKIIWSNKGIKLYYNSTLLFGPNNENSDKYQSSAFDPFLIITRPQCQLFTSFKLYLGKNG